MMDFELFKLADLSNYIRKLSSCDTAVYQKITTQIIILPDPYNVQQDDLKLDLTNPVIYNTYCYICQNVNYDIKIQKYFK